MFRSIVYPHYIQMKVYARGDRKPFLRDDGDKGYVSKRFSRWAMESYQNVAIHNYIRVTILCLFISLNVVMPFILGRITFLFYQKVMANTWVIKSLQYVFWAPCLSLSMFNAAYLYVSVKYYQGFHIPEITKCIIAVHGHPCDIPPDTNLYKHLEMTFIAKAVIFPFALLLDFFIAVVTMKSAEYPKPPCVMRILVYCCCDSWRNFLIKAIQTMALYQILFFVQVIAITTIPTFVFFFVSFFSTILVVGIEIFVVVASILMVAYCLYSCEFLSNATSSRSISLKTCGAILFRSFVFVTSFTMILALLYLYNLMYHSGIDKTGAQGLIFSLLPSILLSFAGWALKKKLYRARILNIASEERQQQARRSGGVSDIEDGIVEMQSLLQEQDENA